MPTKSLVVFSEDVVHVVVYHLYMFTMAVGEC